MVRGKNGFSLAEALVVMTIVSIFFAFAAKTVTIRQKPQEPSSPHGFFECYWGDGTTLKQARVNEGIVMEPKDAGSACVFEPPKGVAYFIIRTYGKAFYEGFEPNANRTVNISIDPTSGSENFITIINEDGEKFIIKSEEEIKDEVKEATENFFKLYYSKSQICNNGNFGRLGILIAW